MGAALVTTKPAIRQRWSENCFVSRHLHVSAYAAVVLAGRYDECGWLGRIHAQPGSVLVHGPFDMHLDHFHRRADILNLELDGRTARTPFVSTVDDIDTLVRLAERDPRQAGTMLTVKLRPMLARAAPDWPEMLAQELRKERLLDIGTWARGMGLAPETATRGFRRVFGVTPARYRSQWRCRRALLAISGGRAPLSAVAAAAGFADQAHMTRQIRQMTGRTPGSWGRG